MLGPFFFFQSFDIRQPLIVTSRAICSLLALKLTQPWMHNSHAICHKLTARVVPAHRGAFVDIQRSTSCCQQGSDGDNRGTDRLTARRNRGGTFPLRRAIGVDDIWIGEASLKTRLHRRNWGMLVDCDLAIEFANASAGTETAARCRARNSPCSPGSLARRRASQRAFPPLAAFLSYYRSRSSCPGMNPCSVGLTFGPTLSFR